MPPAAGSVKTPGMCGRGAPDSLLPMATARSQAAEEREFWYEGAHSAQLFCRARIPRPTPRAVLISLHGLGDHSGLYPMLGEALAPRGIAVYSPDLRGNGRSPGQRGYVARWADLREDLDRLVRRTRAELPG